MAVPYTGKAFNESEFSAPHTGKAFNESEFSAPQFEASPPPADWRFRGILATYFVGLAFLGLVLATGYSGTWEWSKNFTTDISNVAWAAAGATYVGLMILSYLKKRDEVEMAIENPITCKRVKNALWAHRTDVQRAFMIIASIIAIALIAVGAATPGSDKVWNHFVDYMNQSTPWTQIAVGAIALLLSHQVRILFKPDRVVPFEPVGQPIRGFGDRDPFI